MLPWQDAMLTYCSFILSSYIFFGVQASLFNCSILLLVENLSTVQKVIGDVTAVQTLYVSPW